MHGTSHMHGISEYQEVDRRSKKRKTNLNSQIFLLKKKKLIQHKIVFAINRLIFPIYIGIT